PDASVGCDATALVAPPQAAGTTRIITVGRLGALGDNAADDAIIAMLDAARSTLRLSLQDIGPYGADLAWPDRYLGALVGALAGGVDIELVMTNRNARPDGLSAGSSSYSNGWTPCDVAHHVADYATAHPELMSGVDPLAAMSSHFHVATLRQGPDDAW